ncbi:hypothetical protein ACFRDV_22120 [Streptomyces fagopyri]|uniref:hypothetical protein n=1 Tax=Streptomyces fagopyri TaxID=2662397 RepID=UPI003673828A
MSDRAVVDRRRQLSSAEAVLTAAHPEPPAGTVVRDACGREWECSQDGTTVWRQAGGGDPESWTKIAGNYGPVTVLEWGDDICEVHDVPMDDGVCSCCLADSAAAGR